MVKIGQKYGALDIKTEVGVYCWQQHEITMWLISVSYRYWAVRIAEKIQAVKNTLYLNSNTKENVLLHLHGIACNFFVHSHCHKKHLIDSSCLSIHLSLSLHMYQLSSLGKNFHGICYWRLLLNSVKKIPILLKLDRNVGHFTQRPKYVLHCWQ
jgi:hypothetical protein